MSTALGSKTIVQPKISAFYQKPVEQGNVQEKARIFESRIIASQPIRPVLAHAKKVIDKSRLNAEPKKNVFTKTTCAERSVKNIPIISLKPTNNPYQPSTDITKAHNNNAPQKLSAEELVANLRKNKPTYQKQGIQSLISFHESAIKKASGEPAARKRPASPTKQSISNQTLPAKKSPPPVKPRTMYANRIDKKTSKKAFTEIIIRNQNGQYSAKAKLLNSLPYEALIKFGWTDDDILSLVTKEDKKPLTELAATKLGINASDIKSPNIGYYLGSGAAGMVKFALITEPTTNKSHLCVAKKIKPKKPNNKEEIDKLRTELKKEVSLQKALGDSAPKIHGVSETKDQSGNKEFIIFMDKADGIDGYTYTEKYIPDSKAKKKIIQNMIKNIKDMHKLDIGHRDFKLDNLTINPDTFRTQILDLGDAEQGEDKAYGKTGVPIYRAPELVIQKTHNPKTCDIFSLAVAIIDMVIDPEVEDNPFMLGLDDPEILGWVNKMTERKVSSIISRKLNTVKFQNKELKQLVEGMMQVNPVERPTLDQVSQVIENIDFDK
ncbi:protein kinase [uncultured Endozoicomonas sp.]|uniref:protein kinase domain-containing protein n=1 Tax=uncultured Endozoicomonas sp. TaxID=432652 RepID=UPI00261771AA|nr:protein kinase [uncultured Endozoicomonas sp.]